MRLDDVFSYYQLSFVSDIIISLIFLARICTFFLGKRCVLCFAEFLMLRLVERNGITTYLVQLQIP